MTDRLQEVFFKLLRIGLWGAGSFSSATALTGEDWEQLYRYAQNHTVEGLLFDCFPYLREEQLPPRALRLKWAVRTDQIERYNKQMNAVIAEQHAYFVQNGLRPILLKGQGVAHHYMQPAHRVSGDIDWYFAEDGYDAAFALLIKKGIPVNAPMTFCLDYRWNGVAVEHHQQAFDIRSLLKTPYLKKLEETYRYKQQVLAVDGAPVHLLAPELQLLQVNVHILKHLLSFGVGLRQICDAAVLYRAYRGKIDGDALRTMYRRIGVLKWVHVLHRLLVEHLGLPKEDLPFPYPNKTEAEWMMDEIWHSGNFGIYDKRYRDGKVTFVSVHPDGARRLWRSMRLYFPYAPQEVIFFPIRRVTARLTAFFSRSRR